MRFPKVEASYYAMKGGLDLVTPAIEVPTGRLLAAQNYEPAPVGGYRRIDGFERYDGQPAPSSASYWLMTIVQTDAIAVGNTVTGATSGKTGVVLEIVGAVLVLARVSGSFTIGENLQVGGVTKATVATQAVVNAATDPSDHADYRLLAANNRRTDILAVPGSGAIRGVWVYNDIRYAFRDDAGGTAGTMWKATTSGWVQVNLGREIAFTSPATFPLDGIAEGSAIVGGTSGATATVVRVLLRTGSYGVDGVGTLVLSGITGAFQNLEDIKVAGLKRVKAASADTAITRQPGGKLEFVNANFTGSLATVRMYGADGVNLAFEFDGTYYVPIRTGMATDTPKHIEFHRNYLFLTFLGSLQNSSIGTPYTWTVVTGANEIGMGEVITGIKSQTGNATGASLAVFTERKTSILYGGGAASFNLVPSSPGLGYTAYTMQPVGNNIYGLTARGVQSMITTLNYGDFEFASLSQLVQPLLEAKAGLATCSTTLLKKNQYRLHFSDNSGLVFGLTGDKIAGITLLDYGMPVRCICTATLSTGEEVTYFGSDDGYVYQDRKGTSFDGDTLPAWIRPVFNNLQSPLVRKQFRRAVFEVKTDGYSRVNATYDLGYATPAVSPAATQPDIEMVGAGAYWDQFIWDQFIWSAAVISEASLSIDGTEKNIAFLFYSNRAQDDSHTVQGVNLLFSPRRLERA